MNQFVTFVGWACLLFTSIAALAACVAVAANCCKRALERFEWAVDAKTRQDVGRSLDASGWWFSECPDTSLAIRIIGTRLARGESIDADGMRAQWRKARASQGTGDSQS
jgi:hypothetical protein